MTSKAKKHSSIDTVCPVAKVAEHLGDSCTLLIVRDLMTGAKRFGELEKSLSPVSSRTLVKKLKALENEKMVSRKEFDQHPPRVEYSLTRKGAAFQDVVEAMRDYGKKYL